MRSEGEAKGRFQREVRVKRVSGHHRVMIVDIQTRRLRTIGQFRAFVEGNEAVDFRPRGSKTRPAGSAASTSPATS